jgi:hypothetical protein
MMKMILGGLAALTIAGGIVAAPGHADPGEPDHGYSGDHDAYALTQDMRYPDNTHQLPDTRDESYTGTVDFARQMALTICARRSQGYSQHAMQDYVSGWLGRKPSTSDDPDGLAIDTVYSSELHFCPAYLKPPWVS